MNKKKITKPEWIPSSLWNELLYEVWREMDNTWHFFYRSDILQKIYFHLARQVGARGEITGHMIYPPYSNKGSVICIDYNGSQRGKYALEISVDANKGLVSHQYNLSADEKQGFVANL